MSARLVVPLDRRIYRVARRWLPAANAVLSDWLAALMLAPLLWLAGAPTLAQPIYALFSLLGHQDSSRRFAAGGHPLVCCHRRAALYAASAAVGLGYAILHGKLRRIHPALVVALLSLIAIDGVGGTASPWENTTLSRLVIVALAGVALVWLLYPHLDDGFAGVRLRLETLFARLAAEGRFQ